MDRLWGFLELSGKERWRNHVRDNRVLETSSTDFLHSRKRAGGVFLARGGGVE